MKKKKILIFPFDLAAHYLRCLMLAEKIRNDFDIFFCHSDRYADFLNQKGFPVFHSKNFNAEKTLEDIRHFSFNWLNADDINKILSDQTEVIKKLKPDAVIGDVMPTLKIAAEVTGCLYITLGNIYMSNYYALQRPVPTSHPSFHYSKYLSPGIFNAIAVFAEKIMFRRIHKPFQRIRKNLQLKPVRDYLSEMEGDLNLLCDSEWLFPAKPLPPHYHITGPMFYEGDEHEDEIRKWLDCRNKLNVLVNMGSSGKSAFLEKMNFAEFDQFSFVIAGTIHQRGAKSNCYYKPFINNTALLDKIDLVICHGGNGTIYQSLSFGVPLLCLPSLFEQEYNTARIQALHLGGVLPHNVSEKELLNEMEKWAAKKGEGNFAVARDDISRYSDGNKTLPLLNVIF